MKAVNELDEVNARLEKDGIRVDVDTEEKLKHFWRLLKRSENTGKLLVDEMAQQRNDYEQEIEKVAKSMAAVRNLAEDREASLSALKEENNTMKRKIYSMNQQIKKSCVTSQDEIDKILMSEGLHELIGKDLSQKLKAFMIQFSNCKEQLKKCLKENTDKRDENLRIKNEAFKFMQKNKERKDRMKDSLLQTNEKEEYYKVEIMALKDSIYMCQKDLNVKERKLNDAKEMILNFEKQLEIERMNHHHELKEITKSFEGNLTP